MTGQVIHVMTKQRAYPSGASEWRCSTCDHAEVIGNGQRVVTVRGLESVPHGLAEMTWTRRATEEIKEIQSRSYYQ